MPSMLDLFLIAGLVPLYLAAGVIVLMGLINIDRIDARTRHWSAKQEWAAVVFWPPVAIWLAWGAHRGR